MSIRKLNLQNKYAYDKEDKVFPKLSHIPNPKFILLEFT